MQSVRGEKKFDASTGQDARDSAWIEPGVDTAAVFASCLIASPRCNAREYCESGSGQFVGATSASPFNAASSGAR